MQRKIVEFTNLLRKSGVPQADYSYYCELACARLWFHTDLAREAIVPAVERLRNCSLLHFSEMHQYDVCFDDARYGEYYLMADAGHIFFPHDFYQPLANLYFGLFGHSHARGVGAGGDVQRVVRRYLASRRAELDG